MDEEVESVDEISSKTWDVMENKLIKAGLREGIGAGRERVFQPSFDEGYRDGYEMGYSKGFQKGFLSVLSAEKTKEVSGEGTNIPPSPPCNLCADDIDDKFYEQTTREIAKSLRENDQRYVNSLRSELSSWMQKLGIDFASTSSPSSKK
ncbi:hypothetical protein J437_LFUL003912 [Ladona fulva]|uniref:Essential protein Yae1 N-terminal domain-containing protein n=1 Tax=Ladona fulva TaxID=123851 RepID=A0A8K0K725_LADFU|nr:hypothetical protein J437_LFUL003912 [Ladona fulva]